MIKKFFYNNKVLRSRRKELRSTQTEVEKLLWYRLRNRQVLNLKFFRQFSVGPYILDFYCPQIKLAIELDGGQHSEDLAILYDKDRTNYLTNFDIHVIRFWNNEIIKQIDSVLEAIIKECHNALKGGSSSPLKIRGARGVMNSDNKQIS